MVLIFLTHWGRVTHMCVGNLTIIGSDNGLSPGWRQAIIWTNAGILLIKPLKRNFSEILIEIHIHTFSFKKMHLKTSSAKWRPFCLGRNVPHWDNLWRLFHWHEADRTIPYFTSLNLATSQRKTNHKKRVHILHYHSDILPWVYSVRIIDDLRLVWSS